MNVGICVCVLLAALSSGSLSLPAQSTSHVPAAAEAPVSELLAAPSPEHTRLARAATPPRSAAAPLAGQTGNYNEAPEDAEVRSRLNELLARLISRRGILDRSRLSLSSRASGLGPAHRIKDRDYLGWMDFGRRSAEEYEY